jgi:hypothetical protein
VTKDKDEKGKQQNSISKYKESETRKIKEGN